MATEAQIRANQENAQKSSGPTSVEGKKKSSMNAVTHGIFSNIAILPGEDEAFIQRLREDILATYQPQDTMERCLVDRISIAMLRQVRLCEAEAAKLRMSMRPRSWLRASPRSYATPPSGVLKVMTSQMTWSRITSSISRSLKNLGLIHSSTIYLRLALLKGLCPKPLCS